MMTSRSEYRLLLRQDNADLRLTETGHRVGLIGEERYTAFLEKKEAIEKEIERIEQTNISPGNEVNALLVAYGSTPLSTGIKLGELLRRPEIGYEILKPTDRERPELPLAVRRAAEIAVKYAGYVKRELAEAERARRLEDRLIPDGIDYGAIVGLRLEAAEKLTAIRPKNLGQASRISGVNPADVSVLMIYLQTKR